MPPGFSNKTARTEMMLTKIYKNPGLFLLKNNCENLYQQGKCAKLILMKQKILLTMFASWLLLTASSKQTFALSHNSFAAQDSEPTATSETAVDMIERINNYRTDLNLPAYYPDQSLAQASQWVVDTMVATEFISHYDENGANPQQRAEKAGYEEHVTEIIFGGLGGADAAWDWWTENELHHGLLISEDYVEFGVATAVSEQSGRQYWAIMFGFGDGHYDSNGLSTEHNADSNIVTKLPPTATVEITAVSPTSTATQREPTATTEQVALVTDSDTPNTSSADPVSGDQGESSNSLNLSTPNESQWLMIAAVATIILGVAVFYFPRLGISRKFEEKT